MCRCIFDHFYVIGPKIYQIRGIIQSTRPLRRSRSFKVTDFGTNRIKAHMRRAVKTGAKLGMQL